jgi:hypothetical protein
MSQPPRQWTWRAARGGPLGDLWVTSYSSVFFRKSLQGFQRQDTYGLHPWAETRRSGLIGQLVRVPPGSSRRFCQMKATAYRLCGGENRPAYAALLSREDDHHQYKTITKVIPCFGDEQNNGVWLRLTGLSR